MYKEPLNEGDQRLKIYRINIEYFPLITLNKLNPILIYYTQTPPRNPRISGLSRVSVAE